MLKSTTVKLSVLHLIQSCSHSISLVCLAQKLTMEEKGTCGLSPHLLLLPSSVPFKVEVEVRKIIEKEQRPSG